MVKNKVLKITERVFRKHAVEAHLRYGSADEPQAGTNPRMGPVRVNYGGLSLEMISISALRGEIAEAPGRPHVGAGQAPCATYTRCRAGFYVRFEMDKNQTGRSGI